ncbi:hypothetical protein BH10ACT11_BH10ACT11_04270 [soil metagenome]
MAPRRTPRLPFRRRTGDPAPSDVERYLADYILRYQNHCDNYLSRLANPEGKSVLVIGAGSGTEMLWAIRHGATEVIGIDVVVKPTEPLALAMSELQIKQPPPYEILDLGVDEVETLGRRFDLVLSNNTFEHLPDIRSAFKAIRSVVEPQHGRVAIFTDPLFYSSYGAHLPIEPWDHLDHEAEELRAKTPEPYVWHEYEALNKMTLISFLEAVREAEFVILQLFVIADRELARLPGRLAAIHSSAPVTDLALEGIGIELMLPPAI